MPPAGVIHVFNNHNVEPKTSKFWCDTKATSGPTMLSTLVAIRTLKLSNIGTGQFLDGRPLRNSWCSWHGFESRHCWMAKLTSNSAWPLVAKCRGPCKFRFIVQPQIIAGNFFFDRGLKIWDNKIPICKFPSSAPVSDPNLDLGPVPGPGLRSSEVVGEQKKETLEYETTTSELKRIWDTKQNKSKQWNTKFLFSLDLGFLELANTPV